MLVGSHVSPLRSVGSIHFQVICGLFMQLMIMYMYISWNFFRQRNFLSLQFCVVLPFHVTFDFPSPEYTQYEYY